MSIPYEVYVNIVFTIGNCDPVTVPFLVTQESILHPIIGYNVISHVMQSPENTFSTTIFPGLNEAQINQLSVLLSTVPERYISEVRTTKQGVTLRANSVTAVPCKIDGLVMDRATPVLFDPMINHAHEGVLQINESFVTLKRGVRNRVCISIVNLSNSDIVMPGRLLIGNLQRVKSVTPVQVNFKEFPPEKQKNVQTPHTSDEKVFVNEIKTNNCTESDDALLEQLAKIDVSHLSSEQQKLAKDMLWEERLTFSKDPDDIGNADHLLLDINTEDEQPIQKN